MHGTNITDQSQSLFVLITVLIYQFSFDVIRVEPERHVSSNYSYKIESNDTALTNTYPLD